MMQVSFATPREMIEFDGERCTPWVDTQILSAHMHRYLSTVELCRGKRVLDIACGEGYGSAMLIHNSAATVVGMDIDRDTVARASRIYAHQGLTFMEGDIRKPLELDDNSFDVAVCFETIEHIAEHQDFLVELSRVLTDDGVLVISTPDSTKSDLKAPNPFHEKELDEQEFLALVNGAFSSVETYYQGYHFGSVMTQSKGTSEAAKYWNRAGFLDYVEDGGERQRRYVIAVATNGPAVRLPVGFLHDGLIIASLNKRIHALEAELADAQSQIEKLHT